jgi:hypothetical protein
MKQEFILCGEAAEDLAPTCDFVCLRLWAPDPPVLAPEDKGEP